MSDKNLLQSVAVCCRQIKMCLQHLQVNDAKGFSVFVAEVAEKNGKKVKVFSLLIYTILLLYYYILYKNSLQRLQQKAYNPRHQWNVAVADRPLFCLQHSATSATP